MKSDITFLINSCDKYEDAWHPFFECLWHFAGELPYPIVLNTETKSYLSPHYDIQTVNTPGHASWSKRLANVLTHVDTEYVFFLLEDYFLEQEFDRDRFESVISYMKANPDVGMVDIRPRWAESAEEAEQNNITFKDTPDIFIERNNERFNITCSPGIWRTEAMKSLLRMHEDVWDFEIYSGIRAKKQGWKVVWFDTRTPTIYEYNYQIWSGMGITSGHWLPKNKVFFDSLGIEVNYDRLGIMEVSTLEEIRQRNRSNPIIILKKIPRKIRKKTDKATIIEVTSHI